MSLPDCPWAAVDKHGKRWCGWTCNNKNCWDPCKLNLKTDWCPEGWR